MVSYEERLRNFLCVGSPRSLKIEKLSGSSDADVFFVMGQIYKVGPKKEFNREYLAYERFTKKIGSPNTVFPSIEMVLNDDDIVIWTIEFVGPENMEKRIMSIANDIKKFIGLEALNLKVIANIKAIFNSTVLKRDSLIAFEQMNFFVQELIKALGMNLNKAGYSKEKVTPYLNKLNISTTLLSKGCVPSISHKDLSLGNIIISKQETVRFIDPREAVPYLESSEAIGNVAFDLAGYYVSLWRKDLELKHIDQKFSLSLLEEVIIKEIGNYESEHIFSPIFMDLCLAVWFSVYVACKCDYCLSLERKWLYDEMVKKIDFYLENFNLKGELFWE